MTISGYLQLPKKRSERLMSMQHRTYLWLHLVMESLRDQYTYRYSLQPNQFKVEDLTLPANAEEAYEQTLQRTNKSFRSIVRRISLVIIGASRPFTTEETYIVLGLANTELYEVMPDMTDFNRDHLETQLHDWCGLFVS